jgi:hypothetical protein
LAVHLIQYLHANQAARLHDILGSIGLVIVGVDHRFGRLGKNPRKREAP